MPLNYYHEDISRETVNMVRINYNDGNVSKVKMFGQDQAVCAVDLAKTDPDLYSYKGDVVIRKFPYGGCSTGFPRSSFLTNCRSSRLVL